ncbi:MAG: TonB family protein, partial [Candidatus Sulfotelmatobacter sp.]
EPETRKGEPAVVYPDLIRPTQGTQFDVVTIALGLIVLAFAILLSVLIGLRLSGHRVAINPAHSVKAVNSNPSNPPAENSAPANPGAAVPSGTNGNSTSTDSSASSAPPISGPTAETTASRREGPASAAIPPASSPTIHQGKELPRTLPAAPAVTPPKGSEAVHPSGASPTRAVMLSQEEAENNLLHRVEPDYPAEARQQGIQGAVVLDLYIGKDGTVQSVGLVSGQAPLVAAATAALRQWRFKPYYVDGAEVATQTRITLRFTLSGQ